MARKIVIFQNFNFFSFSNFHIFSGYQILTDFITVFCWIVPAIELVSIWHTLDRMSISLSILHLSLENRKNRKESTIKIFKNLKYLLLCKNGCNGE